MRGGRFSTYSILLAVALLISPVVALTQTSSSASSSYNVAPDNSGKNIRDRSANAVTPFTQSTNHSDVETTRKIRRALMGDKSLSTTARNIKVVTVDGTVTLRGPVKSQHEKAVVAHKARQIAGRGHVNDELEIAGR